MKIIRLTLALMAMFSLMGLAAAQNFATVTQGEKGKFYILTYAAGVRGGYLSADGKFVGGTAGSDWTTNVGYVYDIARDSMKITTAADVVKSWTVYAGNNTINRDGQIIEIETRYPDLTNSEMTHASVWAASAGLDTIVTMAYELQPDPSGERPNGLTINVPYLVDGKTGKILQRVDPHWPLTADGAMGFGARVNAANNDATILVGHSSRPGGAQWAPVFWDLKNDTSFFVGLPEMNADNGDLNCTNNDGTLIGGNTRGKSVIIHYDRENMAYEIENLPVTPGKSGGMVQGITETGLVLYVQTTGNDIGSREAYIYNMNDKTVVSLKDYVRELYGLEMPIPSFTAFTISDDGRKITGWSFSGGADVPYLIVLDEDQIFARPRQLNALQPYGEMAVHVSWSAPLRGQYTLKGYNVYCDSVKLNAELIDKTETAFEHTAGVQSGVHAYTVQAVYEEGVSDYCAPMNILVISGDGCLPVQEIGHHLIYNRTAEVYWGLPSAQMSQPVQSAAYGETVALVSGGEAPGRAVVAPVAKSYKNEHLDLVEYKNFGSYSWSSTLLIDNRLYASQYDNGIITVFDMNDMSVTETYMLSLPSISNMMQVDGKLYLATGQEEIVVVDINTMTISNRLKTKAGVKVRHIAYIPALNNGKGGFAYGDWTSLQYCDQYGRELTAGVPVIDIKDLLISGTVYRDGRLYLFSQTGTSQRAELYTVDFENGQYVGKQNLGDIRRLNGLEPYYGFVAGGLSVSTLRDGTVVLAAVMQFSATTSHVAFLELESAPDLLGYNLYRSKDGAAPVRVNPEGKYIQGLSYTEDLTEPGTYVYTVEAVSEGGCTNMLSNVNTKLTVEPIGGCAAVEALTASERSKAVRLDWDYQGSETGPGLVGFNLYRADELLAEHLLDLKYTDFNVAKGDYSYRVEAFYDNSCTASREVQIKVTHEGAMMPPSHISLTDVETAGNPKHYDVEARWELPYFEQPLALGYCNMPYSGTGLKDKLPVYALIGWDSARLAPYRDLYVVGIEYFIGEGILSVDGLVYLNDTLAYMLPQPGRFRENSWNTLMFGRYFSMDQPMELLVGYKVTYSDETKPVAVFDMGPAEVGYGDLFSPDGQQWSTLSASGLSANWCINALVVDKRDLEEAAAAAAAGRPSVQPVVKRMNLNAAMALTEPKAVSTDAAKSSSESVKLQGFNIYREGEKLNEAPLQGFAYTDEAVPAGEYEYVVSAVYEDGERKSDPKYIDLGNVANLPEILAESVKVFPNPARLYFRVEGEYTALEIADLSGKTLRRYTDGRPEIDATGLKPGLYVLRFTLPDGTQRLQKIVLE